MTLAVMSNVRPRSVVGQRSHYRAPRRPRRVLPSVGVKVTPRRSDQGRIVRRGVTRRRSCSCSSSEQSDPSTDRSERVAAIAKKHGIITVVDSDVRLAINTRPADPSHRHRHAQRTSIGGHSDVIAASSPAAKKSSTALELQHRLRRTWAVRTRGSSCADCARCSCGQPAESQRRGGSPVLSKHRKVAKVNYPGLPSHLT